MNDSLVPPPSRQHYSSYRSWRKAAVRYVKLHAPVQKIVYIRHMGHSHRWHRWVLPILFIVVGLILLWGASSVGSSYQSLLDTGTRGDLTVSDRYSHQTKSGISWRLKVAIDGISIPVKGAYTNSDVAGIAIGDQVNVLYRAGDDPKAWWGGDDAARGLTALYIIGMLIVVGGVWFGLAYKGSVESVYLNWALDELEAGRPLPKN